MGDIEDRTFDEIVVGETASLSRTLSRDDVTLFAVMSGDVNPAHVDEAYAKRVVPRQRPGEARRLPSVRRRGARPARRGRS